MACIQCARGEQFKFGLCATCYDETTTTEEKERDILLAMLVDQCNQADEGFFLWHSIKEQYPEVFAIVETARGERKGGDL